MRTDMDGARFLIFPRTTGTQLSDMPLLEGLGREVPETGVQTLAIIVYFYVFENLILRLLACRQAFSADGPPTATQTPPAVAT